MNRVPVRFPYKKRCCTGQSASVSSNFLPLVKMPEKVQSYRKFRIRCRCQRVPVPQTHFDLSVILQNKQAWSHYFRSNFLLMSKKKGIWASSCSFFSRFRRTINRKTMWRDWHNGLWRLLAGSKSTINSLIKTLYCNTDRLLYENAEKIFAL